MVFFLSFFISLLFFSLHLGIKSVNAQDITPSPTYEDLFITRTPRPTENITCPVGNPVGMYTVTPDPYWLSKCSHCITRTPASTWPTLIPSKTPIPTETPEGYIEPTGTQTPTITVTPTVTATPRPGLDCVSTQHGTCEKINGGLLRFHLQGSNFSGNGPYWNINLGRGSFVRPTNSDLRFYWVGEVKARGGISCPFPDNPQGLSSSLRNYVQNQFGDNRITQKELGRTQGFCVNAVNADWSVREISYPLNYLGDNNHVYTVGLYGGYGGWGHAGVAELVKYDFDYYIYVSASELSEFPDPYEPTPTPTPIPGMCSAVESEQEESDFFKMPRITVGQATCLPVGGFRLPTWLKNFFMNNPDVEERYQSPDYDWSQVETQQAFNLCLRPIDFGNMAIFGLNISLNFIALAMGGILLVRIVLRSI